MHTDLSVKYPAVKTYSDGRTAKLSIKTFSRDDSEVKTEQPEVPEVEQAKANSVFDGYREFSQKSITEQVSEFLVWTIEQLGQATTDEQLETLEAVYGDFVAMFLQRLTLDKSFGLNSLPMLFEFTGYDQETEKDLGTVIKALDKARPKMLKTQPLSWAAHRDYHSGIELFKDLLRAEVTKKVSTFNDDESDGPVADED